MGDRPDVPAPEPDIPPAPADDLLRGYPFPDGRFDELFAQPHQPRAHWARFFADFSSRPRHDIRDRQAAAERQIKDSGVTYNVYADPRGMDRPWDLDVLPLIIAPEEWRQIEAGIVQRATLFDRVLGDLYGEQTLLASGEIPPGLVLAQSGFLHAAHGMKLASGVNLHMYAADLARAPDGRWWVTADRTQAPSGTGYALENRLIVSRTFPDLFRDLGIQRLAGFFAAMRDSLLYFAPKGDSQTLCVLLTPGPYNETYFEHTLLARYLGFPLVEGGDLTVRDGRVWLKTLGGLRRVHAILRRQDDSYCDPLELRFDSALGVAGLTDCVRRGTVLIANPLGSGVIESGAMLGFLPRVCERLMGEPLKMPSIATWWCGEPAALEDALDNAEKVVFKSVDPAHWFDPIFGADLDEEGLARLRERIEAHPEKYVAQELIRFSQAPVLSRQIARPVSARNISLRVFAVATPTGYVVMPGGLTRVASGRDVRMMAMQRGGGSKDTWVMSDGPVDGSLTLLRQTVTGADIRRTALTTPSRIAENLFWFGRYQERCDDEARLLREALDQTLQEDDDGRNAERPVHALARAYGIADEVAEASIEEQLLAATVDEDYPLGLPSNLRGLERLAFTLRNRLSLANHRSINSLLAEPGFDRGEATLDEALGWLETTITQLTALSGFALDGMTRDDGWRFLSIGRRLERLTFQSLALATALDAGRGSGLTWLLRLSDSFVTYHSRYMARPEWLPVLDLLVMDRTNPRALAFNAHGIEDYLGKLGNAYGPIECAEFSAAVRAIDELPVNALQPDNPLLRDAIQGLRNAAHQLSDLLAQRFFNHAHAGVWAALGL